MAKTVLVTPPELRKLVPEKCPACGSTEVVILGERLVKDERWSLDAGGGLVFLHKGTSEEDELRLVAWECFSCHTYGEFPAPVAVL